MNKYTLTFKQLKFEKEYQQQRINTISIPVFKFGSSCILVISTFKLITLVLQNQLEFVPILIASQLYSLLSFIFLHFKMHKINIQLILLSYLLTAYEIIIKANTSPQALSLYQNNFAMCGVIIILISEFKESFFIIISTFLFKIIYTLLMETQKSYSIYCSTLILMCFMCFFSYKLNVLNRTNFLLSQYDYMWESVFPKIVDTPYLIFSFSEDRLEFIFKSQNKMPFQCNNSQQLKEFLRDWNYNLVSLENTLFQLYQNQTLNEFHSKKIDIIKDSKNKLSIRYSMMKSLSSTFIIKLDESFIKFDDCKLVMKQSIEKYQQQRIQLIKNIYQTLQRSLITNHQNKLWSIRNSCVKQILNFKIQQYKQKTSKFDVKNLSFLNDFFSYKNNRLTILNPNNNLISTIVVQLKRLFLEIFELAENQSEIEIQVFEQGMVSYEGKQIDYEKNKALKIIQGNLVERIEKQKNRWVIKLHKEPFVKFMN